VDCDDAAVGDALLLGAAIENDVTAHANHVECSIE
jgi:hypothetical protein